MTPADVYARSLPFWLGPERSERGVLLVHGFTGTPFEMRFLGESLAARGLTVLGPALAGHCGSTADLARTRWQDWIGSVERGLDALKERCERVAVCGLSLGGLLTLELARRRAADVRAIAVLASALWLPKGALRFDNLMHRVPRLRELALPKLAGSDIADREMRAANKIAQGKAGMPLPALHSLVEFGLYLRDKLGDVKAPALIMHARQDHTVPFECQAYIARAIGSREVTELVLERSFHVITLDVERQQVFNAVADHLLKHL